VQAGSRIRLRQKIKSVEPVEGGVRCITSENTVEVEGNSRPALVAETIQHAVRLTRERAMRWQRFWSTESQGAARTGAD